MNETTKESKFLDAINQYAEKQKALISREVEEYKAQKIEQATESGLKDAYDLIRRDIAARKSAIITEYAQKEYALRRELYAERQRIAEEVFSLVAERLSAYTTTKAYKDSLRKTAREAAALCEGSPCTVFVREADLSLKDELTECFAEATFLADDTITIGGLRVLCEAKGLLIDDSMDTKLQQQRSWFAEHSGLKVV